MGVMRWCVKKDGRSDLEKIQAAAIIPFHNATSFFVLTNVHFSKPVIHRLFVRHDGSQTAVERESTLEWRCGLRSGTHFLPSLETPCLSLRNQHPAFLHSCLTEGAAVSASSRDAMIKASLAQVTGF